MDKSQNGSKTVEVKPQKVQVTLLFNWPTNRSDTQQRNLSGSIAHYQPIRMRLLPTTLLSSLSKYRFHIRLAFSSSLRQKQKTDQQSIHLKLSIIIQRLLSHTLIFNAS